MINVYKPLSTETVSKLTNSSNSFWFCSRVQGPCDFGHLWGYRQYYGASVYLCGDPQSMSDFLSRTWVAVIGWGGITWEANNSERIKEVCKHNFWKLVYVQLTIMLQLGKHSLSILTHLTFHPLYLIYKNMHQNMLIKRPNYWYYINERMTVLL